MLSIDEQHHASGGTEDKFKEKTFIMRFSRFPDSRFNCNSLFEVILYCTKPPTNTDADTNRWWGTEL